MKGSRFTFLKEVWTHLIRPYWTSQDRWIALGLLSGNLTLMGAFIALTVRLNYWNNEFFTALQELDSSAFFRLLGLFCILAAFSILAYTTKFYFLQKLELRWRQWMTEHLITQWTEDKRYYALQLKGDGTDNPDQRIAEDIHQFISKTLHLTLGTLQKFVSLVSFLGILWLLSGTLTIPLGSYTLSIPGYMCWGALLYAIGGTYFSWLLGKPLVKLNFENEKREANFRYSLVRFRENVDGIALYNGEEPEKKIFARRFSDIAENVYSIIRRMLFINTWQSFYGQFEYIFPFLLAAPRFFTKEITFGGLTQTLSAFNEVIASLSFFVNNFVEISAWKATTDRLLQFKRSIDSLPKPPLEHTVHEKNALHVSCETISLPQNILLQENIDLHFEEGVDTLIMGPTGVGKSTIVRLIAGLWPYAEGKIRKPSGSILFLPQKPYMPLGTLGDAICYPHGNASIKDLQGLLSAVGLEALGSRLDEVNDWARVLSLGEQQHIAIARALLAKPHWLILDEATSAMNEEAERRLYTLLKQSLPQTTLISIGHRESLKNLHTRVISLEEPKARSNTIAA